MAIVTYYCGEDVLVKVSTDEGLTWTTRNYSPGSPGILYDIMAWPLQPDKVTTVGNLGLIQTSIDQGVTWNSASPVLGSNVTFEEVWNVDSSISVVCGTNNVTPLFYTPVFYKSIDGGVSYISSPIRDAANPGIDLFKTGKAYCIHFMTPLIGVMGVIGDLNNLPGYPFIGNTDQLYVVLTLDGGLTWEVTNNKYPLDVNKGNIPWGIKISYDTITTQYIINVVAQKTIHRSIDSGGTYINPEVYPTSTEGNHLTWIGDNYLWYTRSGLNSGIRQSLTVGSAWNNMQSPLLGTARAAHFYQGPLIISGFYSAGQALLKTLDQGATGLIVDGTPAQQIIWAVWTEQDTPMRCFLLQNCKDPSIQYIFQEPPSLVGPPCSIDLSNYIGQSVVISFFGATDPFGNSLNTCPAVADDTTCWIVVQQVTCTGEPCIPIIST